MDQWDRRIRRILMDGRGRDALKKFGISVDVADEKAEQAKPIVPILCPTYRNPEPQMRDALASMVTYTREKDLAVVYAGPPVQASVVHWSRNWLVAEQIKSGKPWSHALFIDDDIVVEPDALERLLSHKKDIVAGLCTRRNDPPIPNIRYYEPETGETKQIWEWPENQLIEVDAVGTGLMLVSQHAFEQVAQAYFDCEYEKEFYGLSGDRLKEISAARLGAFDGDNKMCYWFRFLPTPKQNIEMGEDVGFCFIAKRYCGMSVYVDTSVQPGHIGNYAFSVRDFLPYREMCIEKAKRDGTYKVKEQDEIVVV